jgi:phosphoglycerate kinase
LRFDSREEANDPEFAKELAALGDIYVNEAFANSHRAHASMVGVPALLPSYAGLHILKEIEHLSHALTPPPGSIALIAVTKDDKLPLVAKLARLYHKVLVGGPVKSDYIPPASNILLPTDGIPELKGLLDIGPQTRTAWVKEVATAPFVLWNGPLGWYEKGYTESTDAIAEKIISSGVQAVIGGGDTINALKKFQFDPEKVFLSTGGGAMLQFLANGTLPGIEVLKK